MLLFFEEITVMSKKVVIICAHFWAFFKQNELMSCFINLNFLYLLGENFYCLIFTNHVTEPYSFPTELLAK